MSNSNDLVNETSSSTTTNNPAGSGTTPQDDIAPSLPKILNVPGNAPIRWLQMGWRDLLATRFQGVFYGLVFVLMGYAITWVYATKWQLTMGLIGGFFLLGPFLCVGIYDLSRQYELTGKARLLPSLTCWTRNIGSLAFFTIMLTFVMIVWARVSLILFALSSNTSFPTLQGVLQQIFSIENPQFLLLWAGTGFIFASLVFAIGVVAAPMMLDRRSDTLSAVFSSVRCLHTNPPALYFWAFLVVIIIGASLAAGFIPLLFTAPLIGHATWHAYRELVDKEQTTS